MATLQSAAEKLARKSGTMAQNYNASKGRASARWSQRMSEFLGGPVSGARTAAYQAGMAAAQFRAPDPAYWAQRMRESMMG